jgi:predicted DNA-binding helix-hairpin-helix protein
VLDLKLDPKLAWALKHRERFPVDINRADRELLLRVPGLGVRVIDKLLSARRLHRLRLDDVARLGGSIAKLRPFISAADWAPVRLADDPHLRRRLTPVAQQLDLF